MARPRRKKAEEPPEPPKAAQYDPATIAKLRKYRLANEDGTLRETDVPGKGTGPVMSPEVIDRFLELDTSRKKNLLDWMLYAAGGGKPAMETSERTLELAKQYVKGQRMKGLDRNNAQIDPMTEEQAEADWAKDEPGYREAYFYGDEDLSNDPQYPIFGYFRDWPGRAGVYKKVYEAVKGFLEILNNKQLLQQYNKLFPTAPFQTDLNQYQSIDDLLRVVSQFKRKIAQRRAEKDVQFMGHGGARGSDEVLYEDDYMKVVAPATVAASMKTGFPNWCISNMTRFQSYFSSGSTADLLWGSNCERGPFVFWLFKVNFQDRNLKKLAGHILLNRVGAHELEVGQIQFWDGENRQAFDYPTIVARLTSEMPEIQGPFARSIEAVKNWFGQWDPEQLEKYPPLESIRQAAKRLAAQLLAG